MLSTERFSLATIRNKFGLGLLWIGGASVGMYTGIHLLIPLGLFVFVMWIGNKRLDTNQLNYLPSIAVQFGQFIWLLIGIVISGQFNTNLIDAVIVAVGLVWLLAKPGFLPIVFLSLFQIFALAINVLAITEVSIGSTSHKGLVVHIIFRIMAVILMWQAYLRIKKAEMNNC